MCLYIGCIANRLLPPVVTWFVCLPVINNLGLIKGRLTVCIIPLNSDYLLARPPSNIPVCQSRLQLFAPSV